MGWKRWLVIIGVSFVLLIVVASGLLQYLGGKQGRICESLQPGLSKQELISALGTPIDQEEREGGVWILSFRENIGAAGPITAWVDQKTEKVVRLRCWFEGSSDTWKIDKADSVDPSPPG